MLLLLVVLVVDLGLIIVCSALKNAAEDTEKWKKYSEKNFEEWQETKKALQQSKNEILRLQEEMQKMSEHSEKSEINFALLTEAQNNLKAEKMKSFELSENLKNLEIEKIRLQKIIDTHTAAGSDHNAVVEELKKRADEAKAVETELRAELEAQKERLVVINKEKAALSTQVSELDKENTELLAARQRLTTEKEQAKTVEANLTKTIEELKENIKKKSEESGKSESERETKIGRLERELEAVKGQIEGSVKEKELLVAAKTQLEQQNKKLKEDFEEVCHFLRRRTHLL